MQFLRTLFWVALTVVVVAFCMQNQGRVFVALWGLQGFETNLWTALLAAFLLGLVPTLILHRTTRWRLHRRLSTTERELGETRAAVAAPVASAGLEPVAAQPVVQP